MRSRDGGVRRAPVVVGREVELDLLRRVLDDAQRGEARALFLLGEGGVGKSRLLAEVAAQARTLGMAVLSGRAPVTSPVAFSVVAEALRSWLRTHTFDPGPSPYDAGLRLVLPEWRPEVSAGLPLSDAQLRLLALEGVVHLLAGITATTSATLVVLDDLHDADHDSIEAVRYLATAAVGGVVIIGTLRSGEGSLSEHVVRGLERSGAVATIDLEPLDRRSVAALLAALLDAEPPDELVLDVVARTDGVPLFIEEVLDAHIRTGAVGIDERGARWRGGSAAVPPTVRDMVVQRMERLAPQQRQITTAGAVLGDFSATVLARVADCDGTAVADAVRAGIDVGLLETAGQAVSFRHALIREAVIAATVPHTVSMLHERAAAALNAVDDPTVATIERRAHHLAGAGDDGAAASLLIEAATRHLDDHALYGAEAAARRALEAATDGSTRDRAAAALADAISGQGRWLDALSLDETVAKEHGETEARRLRMATCALEAARFDLSSVIIERAREAGDDSAQLHVVSGRVALAVGDAEAAMKAVDRVLALATDAATRCAGLDLRARVLDFLGRRDEAEAMWTQQATEAAAAGLVEARVRAAVQLGKLDLFRGNRMDRLYAACTEAEEAGALVELAWAEENLAIALVLQEDPRQAVPLLDSAIARCRRLGLDQLPYLIAAKGGAMSFFDVDAAEALLAEAEGLEPTVYMALHTGGIRADMALRAGRAAEAVQLLEENIEASRGIPGGAPTDNTCWLVWALAAAGRPDLATAALEEARASADDLARWHPRPVLVAAAEALLRGDAPGVDGVLAAAPGRMPWDMAMMKTISAAVIAGPDRVRWLREALDFYEQAGATVHAARTKQLLRDAGGPVPRRRRITSQLPQELAAAGVTAREADVLQLLGQGLSNATIANRLFVSVRTVETHVSSLLAKLHLDGRGQLTALSIAVDLTTGSPP